MKFGKYLAIVPFLFIGWSSADAILLSDVLPGEDPIPDDGTELWEISDQDGSNDDVNTLIFREAAGFANQNSLWLYDPTNNARRIPVFRPLDGVGDSTTMSFDISTGIWSNDLGDAPVEFFSQGLGVEGAVFGLLLIAPDGGGGFNEFFSEADLNVGGFDQFLTFDTDGASGLPGVFDYVVGIEDLPISAPCFGGGGGGGFTGGRVARNTSDCDFDDMVIGMTDVIPQQSVASPMPLALVGLGLLALAGTGVSRRR